MRIFRSCTNQQENLPHGKQSVNFTRYPTCHHQIYCSHWQRSHTRMHMHIYKIVLIHTRSVFNLKQCDITNLTKVARKHSMYLYRLEIMLPDETAYYLKNIDNTLSAARRHIAGGNSTENILYITKFLKIICLKYYCQGPISKSQIFIRPPKIFYFIWIIKIYMYESFSSDHVRHHMSIQMQ